MNHVTHFAPGPSQIYFTVPDHIREAFRQQVPSISHRSKAFEEIFAHATDGLKTLLAIPDGFKIVFTTSATEVWERAVQSLVQEKTCHFVNGAFSKKFFETAKAQKKTATKIEVMDGLGFDNPATPPDAELVALIANETSTGVCMPAEFMRQVRAGNANALLMVDAVSALPYQPLPWEVLDSVYFSVQKGFGLPAGLGVWIFNDRCIAKAKAIAAAGLYLPSYHSLLSFLEMEKKNQTPETPNVLAIYLLGKVVEDFNRRGIDIIRKETEYKAAILYQALDSHPLLSTSVSEKKWRSKTSVVAHVGDHAFALFEHLSKHGLLAGDGYGAKKHQQLRFANFPAHSKEVYEKLCDLIGGFHG